MLSCLRPERYLRDAHVYKAGAHDAASFLLHFRTVIFIPIHVDVTGITGTCPVRVLLA